MLELKEEYCDSFQQQFRRTLSMDSGSNVDRGEDHVHSKLVRDFKFQTVDSSKISKVPKVLLQPVKFPITTSCTDIAKTFPGKKYSAPYSDGEYDSAMESPSERFKVLRKSPFILDRYLRETTPALKSTTDVIAPPLEFGDTEKLDIPTVHDNTGIPSVVPPPPIAEAVEVNGIPESKEIVGIPESKEMARQVGKPKERPKLPSSILNDPPENMQQQQQQEQQEQQQQQPEIKYNENKDDTSDSDEKPEFDFEPKSPLTKRGKHRPIPIEPILAGIPEEKLGEKKQEVKAKEEKEEINSSEPHSSEELEPEKADRKWSKSDPMPGDLTPQESHLIGVAIKNHRKQEQSSKSDPNLTDISKSPDQGSSTSIDTNGRAPSFTSNEDSGRETPSTPCTMPVTPTDDIPTTKKKPQKPEMRRHVLQNLYNTEKSYVLNLSIMVKMYLEPLKKPDNINMIEPSQVDEIFYLVPDILSHHELFFQQLEHRFNSWNDEQVIGDIFLVTFTNCLLIEAYTNFVTHYSQAKELIRNATKAQPQLQKFIDECRKENQDKLGLADMLIMPISRIPRYELLLKDFVKYTPIEHPDYDDIRSALDKIKTLAHQMDKTNLDVQQAEKHILRLRAIQETIDGLADLVQSTRKFIRQDLVAEKSRDTFKKDRCLFLFSDLLVCTVVKKKNVALRRGSLGLFTGSTPAEFQRFRFVWKYPLEEVEIIKGHNTLQPKIGGKEMESLEWDLKLLDDVSTSIKQMESDHVELEAIVKKMRDNLISKIKELQNTAPPTTATLSPQHSEINMQIQNEAGTMNYKFHFLSAECKSSWEAYFEDAKQKLAYSRVTAAPEFQYLMPITKTRSGMQFTCAAPSHIAGSPYEFNRSPSSSCDVWVCNSDGYVGQVCLVALVPEAESRASLSVCSAKIVCVAVVPGGSFVNMRSSNSHTKRRSPEDISGDNISIRKEDDRMHIMQFDTDDEEDEPDDGASYLGSHHPPYDRMSSDGSSVGTAGSVDSIVSADEEDSSSDDGDRSPRIPNGGGTLRRSGNKFSDYIDSSYDSQSTMWLGTQDGYLYIYHANETILTQRQRKSKVKVPHVSPVTDILYFENKVFVALNNGELCIYKHDANNNGWQIPNPQRFQVSLTGSGLICMTAVAGRVWCGCQHQVILVNATTFKIENTITISTDNHRQIHKIVSSGLGVWVSLQSSSVIKLYHATTYENLNEIDIAPAVHKMLSGADAIIRQHKAACLRVTSLLICKDLLWIGTSAGVILTHPLPSITANTSVLKCGSGALGSPHGHTGHVRFLTSVEVPRSLYNPVGCENQNEISLNKKAKDNLTKSNNVSSNNSDSNTNVTLVVSGGDGYEDFRYNQQTETVGRDDSMNHLLVWKV